MAGPSRKIGKPTGWRTADGAASPPRIGPRRRWQPGDGSGPRRSGRWVKVLGVLAALAAAAGGIGFLVTLLIQPDPPRLVVVGADPAQDCLRLDVPPDYAGWQTGRQLIAWGRAAEKAGGRSSLTAQVVANGDNPDALPADLTALDDWAGKLAGKRSATDGRVLVYVGLHGGVGADGAPFLWVGKGDRLKVGDLFAKLADHLAQRDVIVLLDPARLPADPQVGRLCDQFADRLAKDEQVKAALDRCPRMIAVCGAAAGEAGWESEDLQTTAFGQAVLKGLRGEAASATSAIKGDELFAFLKAATADWTAGNRPTPQTPVLLPAGDAGPQRAAGMVAAYKQGRPVPAAAVDPEIGRDTLTKLWGRHDELDRREPPPASYAPLAWRRGRELLVRYQQAVRLGERGAAGELERAVGREFDHVEAAAAVVRGAVAEAKGNSIPLAETFGDPRAAAAEAVLKPADGPEGLKLVAFDALGGPGSPRPAEALLAGMVDDFYKKRAGGSPPGEWARAIGVRRKAERAAFGGGPFGERAWPAVKAGVATADGRRREAEDRLFATAAADQKAGADALAEADAGYATAAKLGQAVREASAVRDRLFADLPFLGRWAVASGHREATQGAVEAWEKAHKLADALDAPTAGLGDATKEAAAAGKALRQQLQDSTGRLNSPPESQDNWQDHEHLLACPLVPAELRLKAVELSRQKTRDWLTGTAARGGAGDVGTRAARSKEAARWLARLTAAALGPKRLDANQQADDRLPKAGRVDTKLTELADAKEEWADRAAVLGADLLGHLRHGDPAPKEYPSAAAVDAAERGSRSAVPMIETRVPEPAQVAAAVRWQALLVGLADRTARDHWYDEAQEPYWKLAANRYLADARKAVTADLPRVAGAEAVRADYPEAPRLTMTAAPGTADPLVWTSQRRRAVGFQAAVPAGFPADVAGQAVGWRAVADGVLQWADGGGRALIPVAAGKGGTLAGTLALRDTAGDDVTDEVTPSAQVYFRGQRPPGKLTVKVNRRPERVIRDPLPPRAEATVAVRAAPDVPLGEVAILLDYSGSMREDADGSSPGQYREGFRQADSKFARAMTAVRTVLAALPKGTPLRVRIFSDAGDPEQQSRQVFPESGGAPEVTWDGDDHPDYKRLVNRLQGFDPEFFTPLVKSITTAVDADFTWAGEGGRKAKTLVVLTDGVDEAKEDGVGQARTGNITRRITEPKGLLTQLQDRFTDARGKRVALYVVPFGQSGADDKLTGLLFAGVRDFEQPGRLFRPAGDPKGGRFDNLGEQLLAAVFPKLRLLQSGSQPLGFDKTGHPSRPDTRRRPPYSRGNGGTDLRWSPWVPAGGYTAQPNPGRDTGPRLTLADGDAVVLGFAPDKDGGVEVRRELHADYFDQAPSVTRRQAGGRWAVTSPWPVVERQRLEAVVFVEKVPPHLRTPPEPAQVNLAADPPDPRGDGHEVVWFDLLPAADAGQPPGRLTVTRLYGHPAPAWKLERDDWTGADPRGRVRAVIATQDAPARDDRLPEPESLVLRLPRPDEPDTLAVGRGDAADAVEVRTSVEAQSPDGRQADDQRWLVVRVRHPAGKPVYARLVIDDKQPRAESHHRYYPADGPRADYTAAFRLPKTALDQWTEVRVNLAQVGWAVADARRDRLAVTLDPAVPKRDAQGEPKVIVPPAAGDR